MPLRRTPPTTPTLNVSGNITHSLSDSNLASANMSSEQRQMTEFITQRQKRRRDSLNDHLANENQQNVSITNIMEMFGDLKSSIEVIKEQNTRLQESMDFTSAKYDDLMNTMSRYEKEKEEDRNYIKLLEEKLEQMEKHNKDTSIEIRNIPKPDAETKKDLLKIVTEAFKVINTPIQESEVKDVFRVGSKRSNSNIIMDFTSVLTKEKVLANLKTFNAKNKPNRLNTEHLKLKGPKTPIFISENFTTRTKRIFFLAREAAVRNKYTFCWTSYGRIFVRKEEGAKHLQIKNEDDLKKMEENT
jgi:hypothetical protein